LIYLASCNLILGSSLLILDIVISRCFIEPWILFGVLLFGSWFFFFYDTAKT